MAKIAQLEKLSGPLRATDVGKIAEHLVCADILIQGYSAFLSDQGLPYDVLADVDSKLIRIQVKATLFSRNLIRKKYTWKDVYAWNVRDNKHNRQRLTHDRCDIVALVALDINKIAYIPVSACSSTVYLRSSIEPGRFGFTMDELSSFASALDGFPQSLSHNNRRAKIKRNGTIISEEVFA